MFRLPVEFLTGRAPAWLGAGLLAISVLPSCGSSKATPADWNPAAVADESLLSFFTVNEEGEEHWAIVYFVELDGDLYIRLGGPAEKRIRENLNKPYVDIRIGD